MLLLLLLLNGLWWSWRFRGKKGVQFRYTKNLPPDSWNSKIP
jgi:hypothetical protein